MLLQGFLSIIAKIYAGENLVFTKNENNSQIPRQIFPQRFSIEADNSNAVVPKGKSITFSYKCQKSEKSVKSFMPKKGN